MTVAAAADRVNAALAEVIDPCSVGRGVPAGLVDMGMVKAVERSVSEDGHSVVTVELRITSPACTFQPYFEREVLEKLGAVPDVDEVRIEWNRDFDWSDDDMSPALRQRLRDKRHRLLAMADAAGPPGR
ncbi:metal-sulfur cluster assembly factor [Jatrophihabitans sp. YIM 134969]